MDGMGGLLSRRRSMFNIFIYSFTHFWRQYSRSSYILCSHVIMSIFTYCI
jgi:hypothetical protein